MRETHRERQACRHVGRGQITQKCGSGRVGMRERDTERGRHAGTRAGVKLHTNVAQGELG